MDFNLNKNRDREKFGKLDKGALQFCIKNISWECGGWR